MPEASAVVVATVVLPLVTVTVASASGCGVAQVWSAQAITVPLMVKPVTVRVTATDCLPPTAEPVLSVAVIVMVPEYVPGTRLAAVTLTPNVLPLPPSVPDGVGSTSHALLADAVQVTGREHVPVSPKVTFCVVEVACPCASEKASVAGVGGDNTQGGRTVSVTARVWALPCTATPLASLAAIVTCVV